jgi:hypothetical protein
MADRQMALEAADGLLGKDLGYQPHILVHQDLAAVGGNDAGAFLTTMLQGVKTKVGQFGRILVVVDTAHPTLMGGSSGHSCLS